MEKAFLRTMQWRLIGHSERPTKESPTLNAPWQSFTMKAEVFRKIQTKPLNGRLKLRRMGAFKLNRFLLRALRQAMVLPRILLKPEDGSASSPSEAYRMHNTNFVIHC